MQNGCLRVTYLYDDQADHHFYSPATSSYGRHIWFRAGGVLTDRSLKQGYFQRLSEMPSGTERVTPDLGRPEHAVGLLQALLGRQG